jgi:hypothetical protein
MSVRRLLFASMLVLGCGTEEPAPDKPTWASDVLPILQANCFSCHGPKASYKLYLQRRWDVYDLKAEPLMRMGFAPVVEDIERDGKITPMVTTFTGAKDNATTFWVFAETDSEAGRMPPPPATRLSARDIAVLKNWTNTGYELGSHSPNHKATITWLDKGARLAVVSDGNGDQVLGKLDCGGTEYVILNAGSHKLPSTTCTGTLFDGFDETAVTSIK